MDFFRKNIWASVMLALLISFILPALGILLSPFVPFFFMVMVFLSSINISLRKIMSEIHHPGKAFATLALIHLVCPLAMLLAKPFVSEDIFVGLILASAVPSGIAVVFLTKIYKGDPSRALVITTLSQGLSPILVPLVLFLFAGKLISVSPISIAMTIGSLILVPGLLARVVAHTQWKDHINKVGPNLLTLALIFLITGIISPVRTYIFAHLGISLALAGFIGVVNVGLFLAGFQLGATTESKISYGIAASFKNFALATVLAFSLFNATVALPAIVYAIMNSLLLIPAQWYIEGQKLKKS